ncbi:hypothetical protein AB0H77_37960 [Streptomyces sp. NPDC050844]|uniref:hypothetical protein n=1 Tax=Streptomyces sp. NPDC050844 TaxID=3155790 RepID=UPI003410964D
MTRPSMNRRIGSAVLGVGRTSARPTGAPRRAELPLGRRVLAALLGIRVSAPPRAAASSPAPSPAPEQPAPEPPRSEPATSQRPPRPPSSRTAPYLLPEDRAAFESLLDGVLRTTHERPELASVGQRVNTEQLRTMATNASALITSAAAAEYLHYVKVRDESRPSAPATGVAARGEVRDETGGGLSAVLAVLVPVLAGTAAVILLLIGYVLKMLTPEPGFADAMIGAGWFFGAVTAAGLLFAAFGLVVTALRHRSTAAGLQTDREDEIARAREAWRHALLERGIVPFLREALADPHPGTDPRAWHGASPQVPPLRYAARPDRPAPEHESE